MAFGAELVLSRLARRRHRGGSPTPVTAASNSTVIRGTAPATWPTRRWDVYSRPSGATLPRQLPAPAGVGRRVACPRLRRGRLPPRPRDRAARMGSLRPRGSNSPPCGVDPPDRRRPPRTCDGARVDSAPAMEELEHIEDEAAALEIVTTTTKPTSALATIAATAGVTATCSSLGTPAHLGPDGRVRHERRSRSSGDPRRGARS